MITHASERRDPPSPSFLYRHVFFINSQGKRELRGRWFYLLAAIIWIGGNYLITRTL